MSADGSQAPELISIGGKSVEGFLLTGHFEKNAVTSRLGKNFLQRFLQKNGADASGYDALGADAYFVILDAIERAKSTDGGK